MTLFRLTSLLLCSLAAISTTQAQMDDVRGLPYPNFRYVQYQSLSTATLTSATALGYTAATWNTPGTLELEETSFSVLTVPQQAAYALIGFEELQYDCFVNHYDGYDWDELATEEVQQYFITLGWNEPFWDNATGVPASDDQDWAELSADEQAAAANVCFFEDLWNAESLLDWGESGASISFVSGFAVAIAAVAGGLLM